MLCPLLAGLWTSLGLEKNIVYYRSHSKHLFYKPAHALFLAFDPHTDTPLSEHPFPSYLFFPWQWTQMTASEAHVAVDPGLQSYSFLWERSRTRPTLCICWKLTEFWLSMNYWGIKQGLSSTAEKGGILKLTYEQSQYPAGALANVIEVYLICLLSWQFSNRHPTNALLLAFWTH